MIGMVYHKMGLILGDISESIDGRSLTMSNPVMVIMKAGHNVTLVPLLAMCVEKEITMTKDECSFGAQIFEPVLDVRNTYSTQYGSGIQLTV